ncbi:MAG: COG1361 S-layer family protein [Bellilinea sp.]
MKAKFLSIALLMILLLGVIATQPGRPVNAQTETDTPTGSAETLTEASPPAPTRPLLMIESYSIGADSITPGQRFDLTLRLSNISQHDTDFARNIVLSYSGADFLPVDTGGVRAIPEMDPEEKLNVVQPFIASSSLAGSRYGSITVNVSYTDLAGTAQYTEAFTITINLSQPAYTGGSARPTATPTAVSRPQLVVGSYDTDVDPLQPGSMFTLDLAVTNLGNADSRGVTMVLGGGSADTGTPGAGGVSGGSSDLSTFAPLGSSNLVFLGDLPAGGTIETSVPLVVNVTASPAAYAFKISFVYDDTKGVRQSNDQIITLLVFQLPQVEISYYRDPGVFMTGNMNMLPLQITNVGRKSAVLGNMKVTSANADLSNNVTTLGVLEPGYPFTQDVNVMPYQAGTLDLEITVNYTDDFNQPRFIVQTMTIEVMEMPTPEPFPPDGEGIPPDGGMSGGPETFWQKVVRFFKGLFGLDSSPSSPEGPIEEFPVEPLPEDLKPAVPSRKG